MRCVDCAWFAPIQVSGLNLLSACPIRDVEAGPVGISLS